MARHTVVLALALAAAGCSTQGDAVGETEENATIAANSAPSAWDRVVSRPASEVDAVRMRRACTFERGAMPAETTGAEIRMGSDIPIKTIVVLMQENRSFDSYFGHLSKYAAEKKGITLDIEAAPENASNPEDTSNPASKRHAWQHGKNLCVSDTNHEWYGSHIEWNGGKMDGFFQANQGFFEKGQPNVAPALLDGERALWWYDERDIPFYYDLASTFAVGDHYHSSLIGPTYPNRDFLYAATSFGATTNVLPGCGDTSPYLCFQRGFNDRDVVIFDELTRRDVPWRFYIDGPRKPRVGTLLSPPQLVSRWPKKHLLGVIPEVTHFLAMDDFFADAAAGTLPPVVFLDANAVEDSEGNDEHPPGDIQSGQAFTNRVVQALFASPQWKESVLFLTYDEHGGQFDHVAPPPACEPDDQAPDFRTAADKAFDAKNPGTKFDRYGFRVPITVISPYAKKSFVSHHVYDHTSITRFIEAKFKLPALTRRDANADPMMDFFDFDHPPFMTPPKIAAPVVDQAGLDLCKALYPNGGDTFSSDSADED